MCLSIVVSFFSAVIQVCQSKTFLWFVMKYIIHSSYFIDHKIEYTFEVIDSRFVGYNKSIYIISFHKNTFYLFETFVHYN